MVPKLLCHVFTPILLLSTMTKAEFIFRGQCTRLFQPQEVPITVDPRDVVFNRYIIFPGNRSVSSQDHCQSICLGHAEPPCRTAIFDPEFRTCWLLRAEKEAALEFDMRLDQPGLLSGLLIAPQTIADSLPDRTSGVPGCASFCPAASQESADTITPVCIQDCPNTPPICAGELSSCIDFPRQAQVLQLATMWTITSATAMPLDFMTISFKKKFDFTAFRITVNIGGWRFIPGKTSTSLISEGWLHGRIFHSSGTYNCHGEANTWHTAGREIQENMLQGGGDWSEPIHGEFSCTYYDFSAGNIDVRASYEWRDFNYRVGTSSMLGVIRNGTTSPHFYFIEEYIPAKWMMKLDDSARCQSATVYNSQTMQWSAPSYYSWVGKTGFFINKYKKRSDTSLLRIYWSGSIYAAVYRKCIHLFFTINDELCQDPFSIETSYREHHYSTSVNGRGAHGVATQLDGVCRNLPAGRYDIYMWVDSNCPFYGDPINSYSYYDIGRSRPAAMIVEEIHESLPVNGILMNDGSLVKMPYYNRKYFSFTTGCESIYPSACLTTVSTFTYNKFQSSSFLHVKWYGTQSYCANTTVLNTVRFLIKFNGWECNNPSRIETWWQNNNANLGWCSLRPKYVEGVCRNSFPQGPVTISLHVADVDGMNDRVNAVTLGGTSYLMVEELYDNL